MFVFFFVFFFVFSFFKTREELTETRESLQQMKEKLVGQEESFRKKSIDFDAEVLSLRKANAELEVTTNYDSITRKVVNVCGLKRLALKPKSTM